jgi:catechol 2,3-dioxygenase-like lactoylglutathione lyase family enzyme
MTETSNTEQARTDFQALTLVNHIGLICRNASLTREFYEDVLGIPLVNASVFRDPFREDGAEYCHLIFRMVGGRTLEFFDHPQLIDSTDFSTKNFLQFHIALSVEDRLTVIQYKEKLKIAGKKSRYIEHGDDCSIYFVDPNGINLEILYESPRERNESTVERNIARGILEDWVFKQNQSPEAER